MPTEQLPTFNSNAIELNFYRIKDISEHFGIAPDNMVMIGDTSRDVNAGKNIGCHSILINRSGKPSEDFGQEYTVINTMEILDLIQI